MALSSTSDSVAAESFDEQHLPWYERRHPGIVVALFVLLVGVILSLAWSVLSSERREDTQFEADLRLMTAAQDLRLSIAELDARQAAHALALARGSAPATASLDVQRSSFDAVSQAFAPLLEGFETPQFASAQADQLVSALADFAHLDDEIMRAHAVQDPALVAHAHELVLDPRRKQLIAELDAALAHVRADAKARVDQTPAQHRARTGKTQLNLILAVFATLLAVSGLVWLTMRGAGESTKLLRMVRGMAHTDPLTGIDNRRAWNEKLLREVEQARRLRYPLSVVLFDIDHFKRFNDQYGHPAGDRLLVELARAFKQALRKGDVFARYGGEEFALLLPGCDLDRAETNVERLCALMPRGTSVSAGVAELEPGEPIETWIERVDAALYAAKKGGRARWVRAEPRAPLVTADAGRERS